MAISNQSFIRILVVDDLAAWRRCLIEKLRAEGHLQVVAVATDGLEAIRKAEKLQPDLILLDVGLPRLDGIRAAREIRKVAPESKILSLSQELDPTIAGGALSAGGEIGHRQRPRPGHASRYARRNICESEIAGQ
jgi:DNA-binding NarL/FixJ family response regulator